MLKYLVIQLDDTATSFCHYTVSKSERKPIALEDLRKGVLFAMKENLNVQFVYPDYKLPQDYESVIESIDHVNIVSSQCIVDELIERADIVIFNGLDGVDTYTWDIAKAYTLRISKKDLFENYQKLNAAIGKAGRLNVVITDIDSFCQQDFDTYEQILSHIADFTEQQFLNGGTPQINLLTDRIALQSMNNCNAGDETITLAPDGRFYICPAFYYEQTHSIGTSNDGVNIKNSQLYKLEFAPICRKCDAYHCKRCIWLNHKTTLEVNTPSHEQCVVSHLERNKSRDLLWHIRELGEYMPHISIPEIDYLDPFDKHNKW